LLGRQMLQKLPSEFRILFSLLTNDASMLPQDNDLVQGIANILTGNISLPKHRSKEDRNAERRKEKRRKNLKPLRRIY